MKPETTSIRVTPEVAERLDLIIAKMRCRTRADAAIVLLRRLDALEKQLGEGDALPFTAGMEALRGELCAENLHEIAESTSLLLAAIRVIHRKKETNPSLERSLAKSIEALARVILKDAEPQKVLME